MKSALPPRTQGDAMEFMLVVMGLFAAFCWGGHAGFWGGEGSPCPAFDRPRQCI